MATDVEIANQALGLIGARDTIASLTEDSNEAEKAALFFDSTRDELLQMAEWGFSKGIKALTLLKQAPGTPGSVSTAVAWDSTFPQPPWLYSYSWPDATALDVRAILPVLPNYGYPYILAAAAAFEIGSDVVAAADVRVILTNQPSAIALYTKKVTLTTLWSPLFVRAMQFALAAKMSGPLTGDKDLMKSMYGLANGAVLEARAQDANQGLTVIDQEASWIAARDGCLGTVYPGNFLAPYAPLYLA